MIEARPIVQQSDEARELPAFATALEGVPLNRYEILYLEHTRGLLAAQAFDHERETRVFIKAVDPAEKEAVQRLTQEAGVLDSLSHPQIPRLIDAHLDNSHAYLATEPMLGVSGVLEQVSEARDTVLAARLCLSALAPLRHVHERGFVHRDVKTGNLVMRQDGIVSLVDFELAKPIVQAEEREASAAAHTGTGNITQSGLVVGTLDYMPPEQFMPKDPTPRIDIYSLGCTLHELLTGKPPFVSLYRSGDTQINSHHLFIRKLHPRRHDYWQNGDHVPAALKFIVETAMEPDPIDRFESAEEMAEALEYYLRNK